uniref:Uncharacterized protein n=1 Tax=Ornithodoros erraticus TaxID=265619 RepID=A0A293LMS0_ORNER
MYRSESKSLAMLCQHATIWVVSNRWHTCAFLELTPEAAVYIKCTHSTRYVSKTVKKCMICCSSVEYTRNSTWSVPKIVQHTSFDGLLLGHPRHAQPHDIIS